MHDRLLDALLGLADVRLVASLRDDRLGFPSARDLRVFIPDVHLIGRKRQRQGGFAYSTNHEELLTALASALRDLRSAAADDEVVAVYQLGDFLDLWREAPGFDGTLDAAARIKDDHQELVEALLDRKLKARFLLGNHDLDLYRWPDYTAWERRYFLPDDALGAPSAIVLHGDLFDWVEQSIPGAVKNAFVYLFAPHLAAADYALGDLKRLAVQGHGRRNYRGYIQAQAPPAMGALMRLGAEAVPARWNVQVEGAAPEGNLGFLDAAARCCDRANADYGMSLRVAVIGHTHHARIAVRETAAGELFALVDCGAWIELCRADGEAEAEPSAQLGALSQNEVRLYQLSPRT